MQISQFQETRSELDRPLDLRGRDFQISQLTEEVNSLQEQNELFRAENAKIKQHYKELYDSIKITRAKHTEQTTALKSENESLKVQIQNTVSCVTTTQFKPKVTAPGKYALDVEPIPPRNRNNREVHLVYLRHLKESVDTLRDIVEEAKAERPLDRSLEFACRVYYVEGLGHNLFSVGQFCDSDLEVAFRKHSCYVRDTDGMMKCHPRFALLSNAPRTNPGYGIGVLYTTWNFGYLNILQKRPVRGLPRLIVIKFLMQIQVGLNKTVRFIRTDNGTEFVNKTLYDHYEKAGIFHQKTVPRTPQQNGVVERRNRTLFRTRSYPVDAWTYQFRARTKYGFLRIPFAPPRIKELEDDISNPMLMSILIPTGYSVRNPFRSLLQVHPYLLSIDLERTFGKLILHLLGISIPPRFIMFAPDYNSEASYIGGNQLHESVQSNQHHEHVGNGLSYPFDNIIGNPSKDRYPLLNQLDTDALHRHSALSEYARCRSMQVVRGHSQIVPSGKCSVHKLFGSSRGGFKQTFESKSGLVSLKHLSLINAYSSLIENGSLIVGLTDLEISKAFLCLDPRVNTSSNQGAFTAVINNTCYLHQQFWDLPFVLTVKAGSFNVKQPLSICASRERRLDLKGRELQCYKSFGGLSISHIDYEKGCGGIHSIHPHLHREKRKLAQTYSGKKKALLFLFQVSGEEAQSVSESSEDHPLAKRAKAGKVVKKRTAKSSKRLVDEFVDEGVPAAKPSLEDTEEAILQIICRCSGRLAVIRRSDEEMPSVGKKWKSRRRAQAGLSMGPCCKARRGSDPGHEDEGQVHYPWSLEEGQGWDQTLVIPEEPVSSTGTCLLYNISPKISALVINS
ncbi:integrase, catalytic region, zinc finger, CCHC-type containing protein [Tanacetum coccineum]